MQTHETETINDKKSIRGRFIIQEVIESDLNIRDSTKKRRNTIKISKFKLIAKSHLEKSNQTLFYVYDNMSGMYIEVDILFKQYCIVYNSLSFPSYTRERHGKSRLKLPSLNQEDSDDDHILYSPILKEDSTQYQSQHQGQLMNTNDQCERSPLLKRNERKRIDSDVIVISNSPFNLAKKKLKEGIEMTKFISMDNEIQEYTIQSVISLMLESQNFKEQTVHSYYFELGKCNEQRV